MESPFTTAHTCKQDCKRLCLAPCGHSGCSLGRGWLAVAMGMKPVSPHKPMTLLLQRLRQGNVEGSVLS